MNNLKTQMPQSISTSSMNEKICNLVELKAEQLGLSAREIAQFTLDLHDAFTGEGPNPGPTEVVSTNFEPTVDYKGERAPGDPFCDPSESVHDDFIICLENGKRLKMLKRHLNERYGMSLEEYREKWNLPSDYPMTAPNYSRQKSNFAKRTGLGSYDRRQENAVIAAE
jgi:predicted transcriptional regulator